MVHTGSTHKEEEAEVEAGGMDTAMVEEDVALLEEDTALVEDVALVEEDTDVHVHVDVDVDVDVVDLRHISLQQWYVNIFNFATTGVKYAWP